jgi:hypothetical protein
MATATSPSGFHAPPSFNLNSAIKAGPASGWVRLDVGRSLASPEYKTMNTRTFIIFCITALAAFANAADPAPASKPVPLYIHLIGPSVNGDNSSIHLLTVRVRCSKRVQATARGAAILSSTLPSRRRLIQGADPTSSCHPL